MSENSKIICGCGDQIMPEDGAECGTCVTMRQASQREWQGLTDEEIKEQADLLEGEWISYEGFARAIEQALKEKNYGK